MREAAVLAALPAGLPVPQLCWAVEVNGWAVLRLTAIDGHMPGQPWTAADMDSALAAQTMIAKALAHPPAVLAEAASGPGLAEYADQYLGMWRAAQRGQADVPTEFAWTARHLDELSTLEGLVPAATAGASSVRHFDLRADNIIVTAEGAVVIDWNWARPGPAWADTVLLLQAAYGQLDIDSILAAHQTTAQVQADVVDGLLAGFGYMILAGQRAHLESSPWLRTHQYALGVRSMLWLADRRGWPVP